MDEKGKKRQNWIFASLKKVDHLKEIETRYDHLETAEVHLTCCTLIQNSRKDTNQQKCAVFFLFFPLQTEVRSNYSGAKIGKIECFSLFLSPSAKRRTLRKEQQKNRGEKKGPCPRPYVRPLLTVKKSLTYVRTKPPSHGL